VLHHSCGLAWRQAGVREQVADVDGHAGKFEPGCFRLAVEVGWEGGVESFEVGQILRDAGVDGMLELVVGEMIEGWKRFADGVYVVAVVGAGLHVV